MKGSELTDRERAVLRRLASHGPSRANEIRAASGAGANTLAALTGRGLIARSYGLYRLTDAGREAAA